MIALLDGMPLVSLPDGKNTRFEKQWITSALKNAAEHAGYHRWWLAEHIAESVSLYLRRDFSQNNVEVKKLQDAVLEVLESLGFHDVAGHFRLPDPPVRLSLTDLAKEAGDGYELAFFGLLGSRLERVAGSHAARLEIRDLGDCLRLLTRRARSHKRAGLRDEIVGFIRQYGQIAGGSRPGEPLEIQLS
jgi:hypothetical protein